MTAEELEQIRQIVSAELAKSMEEAAYLVADVVQALYSRKESKESKACTPHLAFAET